MALLWVDLLEFAWELKMDLSVYSLEVRMDLSVYSLEVRMAQMSVHSLEVKLVQLGSSDLGYLLTPAEGKIYNNIVDHKSDPVVDHKSDPVPGAIPVLHMFHYKV